MSTRKRRHGKSRKRKSMKYSSDESFNNDSDDSSYQEPSTKKRKVNNNNNEYSKTISDTLKRTSVLLQNIKHNKFIEVGINSNGKSYSSIKGKLGTNGKKQIKHFKHKKTAFKAAVKLLTNKMNNGYTWVPSEEEEEEEEEEDTQSSSQSSSDIEITDGIFYGYTFSMSGAFSMTQTKMETFITNNGGKVLSDPDINTDFVIVKNNNPVLDSRKCMAANRLKIPIIIEKFLHDSINKNEIVNYKSYIVHNNNIFNGSNASDYDNDQYISSHDENNNNHNINNGTGNGHNGHSYGGSVADVNYNYNYLCSTMCLKTTDESIETELLSNNGYIIDTLDTYLDSMKMHEINGQILAEICNVLTEDECNDIIGRCNSLSFQNLNRSNKYDKSIRKSDRLLVLDSKLSNILWNRLKCIIVDDIIDKYYVSTIPLGFGVLNEDENNENNWDVSCINIGMRIMRYDSNNDDFFTFHKDGQYAASADQRSLFTLIIYLNDDFDGGETNFYFNKSEDENTQIISSDCTIAEEIKYFGGIEKGFDCKIIKPQMGNAIIFSPDLIHEGCKISTSNKYKYILKTDIIAKRYNNFNGFAISLEESNDYERCLNYFTEAQRNELLGNKQKANELYERSLYIRYSYPTKLLQLQDEETENKPKIKLYINIDSVWLTIFEYSHIREMECISYLFPSLYNILTQWKLLYDHRHINNDINNTEEYIPKLIERCGQYHIFEWNNKDFFFENEIDCCRVTAIYAFYLMSHRENSNYFIAQYNTHTQNVIAIPLYKLLKNVFYNRECYGSYFKIKKESDNILNDFNNNIDRDYMSIIHNSQFMGGIGLLKDNKFKCKIKQSEDQTKLFYTPDKMLSNNEWISCAKMSAITTYMSHPYEMNGCWDVDTYHDNFNGLEQWLDTKFGSNKGDINGNDDKIKYLNDLITIKNEKCFGCGKTRIFGHEKKSQQYCLCPFRDNEFSFKDDIESVNHLVFDFSKNKLNVIKENSNNNNSENDPCNNSCISLKNIIKIYVESNESHNKSWLKLNTLQFYKVNIESLFENNKSMSFNHASCQCGFPLTDTNITNYFGYNHLKHIHVATMETNDNKIMMWLSYNNIAAL